MTPEITIGGFLEIGQRGGIVEDKVADYNRGSDYESLSGPNSIIWSHQSQRDTDLWRATRFGDATGTELTKLVEGRYGILRVKDTRGVGWADLRRPTVTAGAGTVWRGTRIKALRGSASQAYFYRVTQDTPVGATTRTVRVPIEAVKLGPGSKNDSFEDLSLEDGLWDAWAVTFLRCADGTSLEPAPAYRTRARAERVANRVGHLAKIEQICFDIGARVVTCFQSNYAGVDRDYGLNYVYVGDLGYTATPALVRACTLALRSARVAGDNLQVLPLTRSSLSVEANVFLRDSPQALPLDRIEVLHRKALIHYMGSDQGRYEYTVGGLEAAVAKTGIDVQDIQLIHPTADATILATGNFPAALPRYFLEDHNISLHYFPPE